MSFGNRFSKKVLDHILGGTALTALTNVYMDFSTADPGEDIATLAAPTIGTGGYAALAIPVANLTVTEGDPSSATNNSDESFPESTAAWSTGATPLTYATWWTHPTTRTVDTFIGSSILSVSRKVEAAGVILYFKAGELTLSLD